MNLASTIMSASTTIPTIYFGYGSNLWREQMSKRCPNSTYVGIGRLSGYRWQINDRGYANVVKLASTSADIGDVVYGLIYTLTPDDELRLDANEGVPDVYTKEILSIDFWPSLSIKSTHDIDKAAKPEKKDMLVYVDTKRVKDSKPKAEYVIRMNHGIDDALAAGVPEEYVNEVLRKSIPPIDMSTLDHGLKEQAKRQAGSFRDE
jgi:gamma-glutamylcyclotransferase